MSRLLAVSGDVVYFQSGDGRHNAFTLTAFDPATGCYIGLAHGTANKVVGCTPMRMHGIIPTDYAPLQTSGWEDWPLLGPILRQGPCGVCGQLMGQIDLPVVEIARAEPGPACIITAARPYEDLCRDRRRGCAGRIIEAIPIEITTVGSDGYSDDEIHFTAEHRPSTGMSGSPILQHGRLVGAVQGYRDNVEIGRHIETMIQGLLEVERVPKRKGLARNRSVKAYPNTQNASVCRSLRGKVYYQALVNKAPEMTILEAQVRQYEAGRLPQGILYGSHKCTYQEALRLLWQYQTARWKMAVKSWYLGGLITKEQYHAILRGGAPPEV